MKIIFNRNSAANAVAPLMATAVGRSTLPAVEGILIEAKMPDTCILTTYDLEKGMRITIEAKVIEEGFCIINAQKFNQTLHVMESDEITLTIDEKLNATITSGVSTFKMNALDGEDFPAVPSLKSEMSFFLGQGVLRKMFSKTMYAMATADQRQILNGCYVHVENDEILVVSCDSFKLAKCYRKTDLKSANEKDDFVRYSFVLPVKTVNEIYKLLSDDDENMCKVYVMRKHIVFEIGNIIFFSRLIEGEYIDYDRIILTNHKICTTVDRSAFISALERAALITEEKIAGSVRSHVKINMVGDIIKVSAISTNGSSYDEVSAKHDGEDVLIAFNNRYLMDSVRAVDTEKVKLSLSSSLSSMNIEPVDLEDGIEEIFMLLPVRMKE